MYQYAMLNASTTASTMYPTQPMPPVARAA
jgi:hypothetical protein